MAKTKKGKPLTDEQKKKRAKLAFKRKIRNIFTGAGFTYVATNGHHINIGRRNDVEIDSLFIYENIWLLCEDTTQTSHIKEHIRIKDEAAQEIRENLSVFITKLVDLFPEQANTFTQFDVGRIQFFYLYIPSVDPDLSSTDYALFNHLTFVLPQTLNYFQWIVHAIKHSARNELFRFLGLNSQQIGLVKSDSDDSKIEAPIIYPKEFTGLKNGVRIVSFMMSAESLLNNCYVLRKDNWEDSIWLYQRLIEKNKIQKIREFLVRKGEAFYNNIIVALPDSVSFIDGAGDRKSIETIGKLEGNCKLVIPKEINSICVIDGQHRIFAHYESGIDSAQERKIANLRSQLHLLVTGLVFPPNMSSEKRAQLQSQIFLDINSNAKAVPPNVLLQIQRISNPIADESIAQYVVEKLNKQGVFAKQFQLSALDPAPIKTASLVRFALRYLVTLTPAEGKQSLFQYWNGDREALQKLDSNAISDYADFCASQINIYFSAIKQNLQSVWDDPTSKLLSVISINGFVIALTRQLSVFGIQPFDFYDEKFKNWKFDFSKENFPYTSSQYRKFSNRILEEVFGLTTETTESL